MGSKLHSFQRSPLGAFRKSPLDVRNGGERLMWCTSTGGIKFADSSKGIKFADSSKNVLVVGALNKKEDDLEKIGLNEGFNSFARDIFEYKGRIYVVGNITKKADASGDFDFIATYNDKTGEWDKLTAVDLEDDGHTMTTFRGDLIVGGQFTFAGDAGSTDTFKIAAWNKDDNWFGIGGLSVGSPFGMSSINDLIVFNDLLIAAGAFFEFPGPPPLGKSVSKWDGKTWTFLSPTEQDLRAIDALEVYKDELWVGGPSEIKTWAGALYTSKLLVDMVGLNGHAQILGFTVHKGNLIAAGNFNNIAGTSVSANVAKWDGKTWSSLGTGLGRRIPNSPKDLLLEQVNDVHSVNGKLYAIGNFTEIFSAVGAGASLKMFAVFDEKNNIWKPAYDETGVISFTGNALNSFTSKIKFTAP